VQGTECRAGHQLLFGFFGTPTGILEAEIDEGGDARVARLDAREKGVDDLDRREIMPTDAQRQFGGAHVSQFVGQRHLSTSRD
jgi:hypothetical protein